MTPPATPAIAPATSPVAAPGEDVAPPQLALANPYTDSYALSTDYALTSHLLGLGFNALSPYAGRIRSRWLAGLARAGLATPLVLAEIAAMTYSHEMGHFRADTAAGGDPSITYPRDHWWKIWSGVTAQNPTRKFTPSESLVSEGAGVNQEQWNADYLFWDAARRGGGLSEAAAYFLARSNTFLYSAVLPLLAGITDFDDINQYRQDSATAGHPISRGAISWGSGLTTALSSGTFGAFRTLGRYFAGDEPRFDIPTANIEGFDFTLPDFHYLLSTEGPVIGGNALLFPRSRSPLGVSLDVRPDTPGVALGAHLYDLRLGDRLRISPFASVSEDKSLGPAARFGSDVRVLLPYGFQFIATPSYTIGTHLLDQERGLGGFRFSAGIGVPFR
jgi:hypothetical protein